MISQVLTSDHPKKTKMASLFQAGKVTNPQSDSHREYFFVCLFEGLEKNK